MIRWLRRTAPVAALATGACVATQGDVRVLQNDLAVMRSEVAEVDSARRAQMDTVIALLRTVNDSLRHTSTRLTRFQADVREDTYNTAQQLLMIQELTGQSQRRLQELRASLEQRTTEAATVETPEGTVQAPPGPNQLYQLALEQLRRGSYGAGRSALEDLLRQHPTADIAPDAHFWIAESQMQEGNAAAADSVYALVVARYPQSNRAPTALYRRALILRDRNETERARATLEEVVRRYPRADEAELARELLRTLR